MTRTLYLISRKCLICNDSFMGKTRTSLILDHDHLCQICEKEFEEAIMKRSEEFTEKVKWLERRRTFSKIDYIAYELWLERCERENEKKKIEDNRIKFREENIE